MYPTYCHSVVKYFQGTGALFPGRSLAVPDPDSGIVRFLRLKARAGAEAPCIYKKRCLPVGTLLLRRIEELCRSRTFEDAPGRRAFQ